MRVQQQGQSLRLRIDEAELTALLAGNMVDNQTRWPDGHVEQQQLVLAAQYGWQRTADGCRVALADTAIREIVARLPSRDGLQFDLALPDGGALHVLFDVDVRDSMLQRRVGREGRG